MSSILKSYYSEVFNNVNSLAKETCPVLTGKVKHQQQIGFIDPAEATGSDEKILSTFREVRDSIKSEMYAFFEYLKASTH